VSLRLLCLDGSLARAEPKTLRYRLLHTRPAAGTRPAQQKIKIPETWACACAHELETCFLAAFALPPA